MDEQTKDIPEMGDINSPSNWRAEAMNQPTEQKQNFLQRFISRIRGGNTMMVSSDGGPKVEMTQAEADAQVQAEKEAAEERAKGTPGAKVDVVQSGETTEVRTTVPGESKPVEEESPE